MNEINFFNIYKDKEKKIDIKNKKLAFKKSIPVVLLILFFAGLISYQFLLFNKQKEIKSDINQIQNTSKNDSIEKKYNEAKDLKKSIDSLNEQISEINPTVDKISNDFYFSSKMIAAVIKQIPKNTYLKNVSSNNYEITIDAITSNYNSAAQYLYNLKEDNNFIKSAFIPYIKSDENDYEYSIQIILDKEKLGGDLDEKIK